jgi:hypothetical protein
MVENVADAVQGAAPLAFPLESSRANQRVIDLLFHASGRAGRGRAARVRPLPGRERSGA